MGVLRRKFIRSDSVAGRVGPEEAAADKAIQLGLEWSADKLSQEDGSVGRGKTRG